MGTDTEILEFQAEEFSQQCLLMRPLELAEIGFELRVAAGAQGILELAAEGVHADAHRQRNLVEPV